MSVRGKIPLWAIRRAIKRSERNCIAKVAYKTIAAAETAAKKYQQRMYICQVCSHYHLTTQK